MAALLKKFFAHFGSKKSGSDSKEAGKAGVPSGVGFSVKVAAQGQAHGPVVCQCLAGDGGVQGFTWYVERLCADDDGDVAQEFWREVAVARNLASSRPRLEAVLRTRPVNLRGPVLIHGGNVHQYVESAKGVFIWA